MLAKRIIPCLDGKDGRLVKGVTWFTVILFAVVGAVIPMAIIIFEEDVFVGIMVMILYLGLFSSILPPLGDHSVVVALCREFTRYVR